MFRFSTLLTKSEAEAGAARPRDPRGDPPPSSAEKTGHPMASGQCVSDRVRRDLDEQMTRLGELLDRVESLEFDGEAAASEMLTLTEGITRPVPASHGRDVPEEVPVPKQRDAGTRPAAASGSLQPRDLACEPAERVETHSGIRCELVVPAGVFARMSDLPVETEPPAPLGNAEEPRIARRPTNTRKKPKPRRRKKRRTTSLSLEASLGISRDYSGAPATPPQAKMGNDDAQQEGARADRTECVTPCSGPDRRRLQETVSLSPIEEGNGGSGAMVASSREAARRAATPANAAATKTEQPAEGDPAPLCAPCSEPSTKETPWRPTDRGPQAIEMPAASSIPEGQPATTSQTQTTAPNRRAPIRRTVDRGRPVGNGSLPGSKSTDSSLRPSGLSQSWSLNALALCGGLLALAALLYVAADLIHWF